MITITPFFKAALCGAGLLLASMFACAAEVPKLINYQGKLTNATGEALPDGEYSVKFELYDAAADGNLVWGESRTVTLIKGVFNVALGGAGSQPVAGAAVNDIGFAFGQSNRFLQTTIVSGPGGGIGQVLAPRQQMTGVPYAVEAQHAAQATEADNAGRLGGEGPAFWLPPGMISAYGGASDPPGGWLICDGREVSRTEYEALWLAIGESYGPGDGTTTFNLPNGRGLVLRGSGEQAVGGRPKVGPTLGNIQEDQFQGHRHGSPWWQDPAANQSAGDNGRFGSQSVGGTSRVCGVSGGTNYGERYRPFTTSPQNDGSNGSPRIGDETRVSSLGVNFIIKY